MSLRFRNRLFEASTTGATSYALLLSCLLVGVSFVLQGHIGLQLSDEGYLWYGASRTAAGELPIRDFQSYDPGRYYWAAPWLLAFSDRLIVLRLSVAVFQVFGLWLGVLAARRAGYAIASLAPIGCVLLVWMLPRHKLFECTLSIVAVFLAMHLIKGPSRKQYFIVGLFVGLSAFFARNLGLYHFISFLALILYLRHRMGTRSLSESLPPWLLGIFVGYSPMILLNIFVRGYVASFVESIEYMFIKGSLNITRPVPWPWTMNFSMNNLLDDFPQYFTSLCYLLLPGLYLTAIGTAFIVKKLDVTRSALFIASGFIGLPYLHHCFSRADLSHLGQSIHPFLLGLIGLPIAFGIERRTWARALGIVCLALVFLSGARFSYLYLAATGPYVERIIQWDTFLIPGRTAELIDTVRRAYVEKVNPGDSVFIAPHYPGLYSLLRLKSPVREIFFLRRQTETAQAKIISQLEENNTNWAILADATIDDRDDLRFSNTNKLVWNYLMENFVRVPDSGLSEPMHLYRRVK